jgi:copper chaperone CopZ
MKVISSLMVAFILLVAGCNSAPESEQEQSSEKAQINPDHVVLIDMDVNGMTCTGCENTIKTGVSELEGVVSVEASHIDAKTWIKADTTLVDIQKIKEVISARGYEVVGSNLSKAEETSTQEEGIE